MGRVAACRGRLGHRLRRFPHSSIAWWVGPHRTSCPSGLTGTSMCRFPSRSIVVRWPNSLHTCIPLCPGLAPRAPGGRGSTCGGGGSEHDPPRSEAVSRQAGAGLAGLGRVVAWRGIRHRTTPSDWQPRTGMSEAGPPATGCRVRPGATKRQRSEGTRVAGDEPALQRELSHLPYLPPCGGPRARHGAAVWRYGV